MTNAITEKQIRRSERVLGITFPASYREFLLTHGSMEIAGFGILGIPKRIEKPVIVEEKKPVQLSEPQKIEADNGWLNFIEIKKNQLCPACGQRKDIGRTVCYTCYLAHSNENRERYVHVAVWIKKKRAEVKAAAPKVEIPNAKAKKPSVAKQDISIVEATEFLRKKRPDLVDKKLIPIFFKQDLNTEKQMVLCMDLSGEPKDDAPLIVITDLNQQGMAPLPSDQETFSEWLEYIQKMGIRHEHFKKARRLIKNRNNEILEKNFSKAFDKMFGQKCPVCQKRERESFVTRKTNRKNTRLVCRECKNEWQQSEKKLDIVEWVREKLKNKFDLPCFTEKGMVTVRDKEKKPNHIHLEKHDWRTRIFRVTDYVVGLTAFRYNTSRSCLEVDAFWSGDLAGYENGQAIRNLAIAVLSEANSLTGSLALAFTRDVRESEKTGKIIRGGHGRTNCPIPKELIRFAEKNGVKLNHAENGIITHQEGLEIFWAALGWPEHLQSKVDELEKKGYLTKQALASVIYSGIWSLQEAIWLFENAPRPEAVLLGSDIPENRLYYTESLHWGRSAYLANLLKIKVSADLADGLSVEEREESDCELEPCEGFWTLKAVRDFNLPWMVKGSEAVLVKANEPVLILSVPYQTTHEANDLGLIKEGFKRLKESESPAKVRCLIVSFEFSDLKYGMKIAEFMKDNSKRLAERDVYLLFSPYRLDLLNDEAESRMAAARRRRQFPSRKTSLPLQLIEIPEARWQKPDLLYSVEDAKSATYWIEKKIDQRLGRIRLRVNCSCIERIAVQDADAKKIMAVDGKDSNDILTVMTSENGITLPFVLPGEVPELVKKTSGKLRSILKTIKGGLVAIATFEKSAFEETVEAAVSITETCSVGSDFRFSVSPDGVDFESYAVNRPEEITRTHQQIQQALRNGEPLAVSYLRHEVFVEAIREYLFYDVSYDIETTYEERRIAFFTQRVKLEKKTEIRNPAEPVNLRIVYNDGTEGQPFPLFCLPKRSKPKGLYQMNVGSISMRHVALDSVTDGYLIQNIMISKRKLSSVDQEDYAFRRTWHFLTNFVDLVQHKKVKKISQEIRFKYLWHMLGLKSKKGKGCELHIFQTGLVPATVGIYRAVIKFLQEKRGELVVVPRLIGEKAALALKKEKVTVDAAYLKAAEWL